MNARSTLNGRGAGARDRRARTPVDDPVTRRADTLERAAAWLREFAELRQGSTEREQYEQLKACADLAAIDPRLFASLAGVRFRREPVGIWRGRSAVSAHDPERPLLVTVDCRAHPDERVRRDGLLMVFEDYENGDGVAEFHAGMRLADATVGGTRLWEQKRTETPSFEVVLAFAPRTLVQQLTGREDPDPRYYFDLADREVTRAYHKAWHAASRSLTSASTQRLAGGRSRGRMKHLSAVRSESRDAHLS